MQTPKEISVIIPARNEAALISSVLDAVLASVRILPTCGPANHLPDLPIHLDTTAAEIIVIDNESTDQTPAIVQDYANRYGVHLLHCSIPFAASARNHGVAASRGRILVFVDADTLIPPTALCHIMDLCSRRGYIAGITRLASLEHSIRASIWWTFWEQVRRLPLARAKAMPALMFCTRMAFEQFGPFDERVRIGEEWPILAGVYRTRQSQFIYDRTLTALTSSRRMELQEYGYLRTLAKYVWAVLHPSGRVAYTDHLRHTQESQRAGTMIDGRR